MYDSNIPRIFFKTAIMWSEHITLPTAWRAVQQAKWSDVYNYNTNNNNTNNVLLKNLTI